jgi:hypothetical protein
MEEARKDERVEMEEEREAIEGERYEALNAMDDADELKEKLREELRDELKAEMKAEMMAAFIDAYAAMFPTK